MTGDETEPDVDSQLQLLNDRAANLIESCQFASSSRLYGELRQRARSEQRAWHYVVGTFFQMDQAQYLLDFKQMRERAVELIALLEDEERVRQIQSDFPAEHQEHFVYTMSSCAYENLAEATGQLDGYNSEGMHACIADGLQICRRTGKMDCLRCFREYACDVYTAADDREIASHQCQLVVEHEGDWSDRGNRRWFALIKQAWLATLHGAWAHAGELIEQAVAATDEDGVSLKLESRVRALILQDTVRLATGLDPVMTEDAAYGQLPATGECPLFEHMMDLNLALQHSKDRDWSAASRILTHWDQRLQRCGGSHLWFETRLRLIAVKRLSEQQKQAEALAQQLETAATRACDWLTIRRLEGLMESSEPDSLASVRRPESLGAKTTSPGLSDDAGDTELNSEPADINEAEPELSGYIAELHDQMEALANEPTEEKLAQMQKAILAITPDRAQHHRDAAAALHLMTFVLGSGCDGNQVWEWANSISTPWQNKASVVSLLGTVGDSLRVNEESHMADRITADRTEQLFRRSLQLDTTRPGNFMPTGDHFRAEGNHGEAERCYARAFRLDRTAGYIVGRLAELYLQSDRPRDALHVLDLSLREGCRDPQVAFDAAMAAFSLNQFGVTITCLDRFQEDGGQSEWVNYYRAVCLYELDDPGSALQFLDVEDEDPESAGWHVEVMRGVVLARLGQHEPARHHLQYAIKQPLYDQGYLSTAGIASLLMRMVHAAEVDLQDAEFQTVVNDRLLKSGLMPDSYFDDLRKQKADVEDLRLCRCLILQPVSLDWQTNPDRLSEQDGWDAYVTEWGVLATSVDEAVAVALDWQSRCSELPATVEDVHVSDDTFCDAPGIVWQSGRFRPEMAEDDEAEDEPEF